VQPQLGRDPARRQAAGGDPINRLALESLREYPALTTFHPTLLSSSEKLAWVSTETREDQSAVLALGGAAAQG
jgi:hypothetical protein